MNKLYLQLKERYRDLPPGLKTFLIRALIIFVGWRLLYYFVLDPINIPDQQLIDIIVVAIKYIMSYFFDLVWSVGDVVWLNNRPTLQVAKDCNGLELIVLYIGFLMCIPTKAKRFWTYALIGPVLIMVLNIIRCVVLGFMFYEQNRFSDFAHHYGFKLIIYGVIFLLWMGYSKKYKTNES